MPRVAISYRRDDSPGLARLLYERLTSHYGAESVFIDIDAIEFGEDYRERVNRALKQTDCLLVLIGPRWLGPTSAARHRINDAADPVRLEVERAFEIGLRVVPVLLQHTPMPSPTDMPESLRRLPDFGISEISSARGFDDQADSIIRFIDSSFAESTAGQAHESGSGRKHEPLIVRLGLTTKNTFARKKSWQILAARGILTVTLVGVQLAAPFARVFEHTAQYGFRDIMLVDSILLTLLGFSWSPFFFCGLVGVCGSLLLEIALAPIVPYSAQNALLAMNVSMALFIARGVLEAAFGLALFEWLRTLARRSAQNTGYRDSTQFESSSILAAATVERTRFWAALLWTLYLLLGYFSYRHFIYSWFPGFGARAILDRELLRAAVAITFGAPSALLMILMARKVFLLERIGFQTPGSVPKPSSE